jgi:hypothetical protein
MKMAERKHPESYEFRAVTLFFAFPPRSLHTFGIRLPWSRPSTPQFHRPAATKWPEIKQVRIGALREVKSDQLHGFLIHLRAEPDRRAKSWWYKPTARTARTASATGVECNGQDSVGNIYHEWMIEMCLRLWTIFYISHVYGEQLCARVEVNAGDAFSS